ncbi:hypothetical protein OAU13_01030 [bacterium]|nr:hypothetical protein [bacterium]
MNKATVGAIACLVVASCGGGGSDSSAPTLSTPKAVIKGKVIDGYVSGATVYVDTNWSLAYEQGEPQTTSTQNGDWQFTESDVSQFQCWQDRPIIVDVPAGAVDNDRGVVSTPYRMVYLPGQWVGVNTTNVNITPFTSLFAGAIADATVAVDISVSNGCGAESNSVAATVKANIRAFADKLRDAGVPIESFYNDYILSNDTVAQRKGEFIVDYLAKYQDVSKRVVQSIQQDVGATGTLRNIYAVNFDVVREIVTTNPQVVPFDVVIYGGNFTMPNNEQGGIFFNAKGTKLRNDGLIISSACTESNPFACEVVNVENEKDLIKASLTARKTIRFDNRSLTFTKQTNQCTNEFLFVGSQDVEFIYKTPIENASSVYGCVRVEDGVQFSRRIEHRPTTNGYTYSLFRYYGNEAVTLPYLQQYISSNILTTQFTATNAVSELGTLPYSPKQVDEILSTFGSSWVLQTGSETEDAALQYFDPANNLFKCVVRTKNTNNILREVVGTKEQALSACYPDLSVY